MMLYTIFHNILISHVFLVDIFTIGRPGVFPQHHTQLLPRRRRCPARLRHHSSRVVQPPHPVAGGGETERQSEHDNYANRKQERLGATENGQHEGGRALRAGERTGIHGDLRQDRRQRRDGEPATDCVHRNNLRDTKC